MFMYMWENPPANLDKVMDEINKVAKRTDELLKLINIFLLWLTIFKHVHAVILVIQTVEPF